MNIKGHQLHFWSKWVRNINNPHIRHTVQIVSLVFNAWMIYDIWNGFSEIRAEEKATKKSREKLAKTLADDEYEEILNSVYRENFPARTIPVTEDF